MSGGRGDRGRFSKAGQVTLLFLTVVGGATIGYFVVDVSEPLRDPPPNATLDVVRADAERDVVVLAHRGGESVSAQSITLVVTVGERTVRWNGSDARPATLDAGERVTVGLSTGRVWWGTSSATPTWERPTRGAPVDATAGAVVEIRLAHHASGTDVVSLDATAQRTSSTG